MFYRALTVGIVLFWVAMTVLLVRLEMVPGESEMLPVPTAFVWRLVFKHEEASDLGLYDGRQRLGSLHLQPRRQTGAGGPFYQLTATGAFALDLPGLGGQRMVFHGTLDLNEQEAVEHVDLAANFRPPRQTGLTVVLDGRPALGQWHYAIRRGENVLKENSGSVESLLDDPDLRGRQQAAAATITARHGTLHMHAEDVETYVVTIRQGDGLESSIHLNQLGQILAVKTFLGYDLYDEAFAP